MCEVAPGHYYYIVSTTNSWYTGSKLAITFPGEGSPLIANELNTYNINQVWNIAQANNGQLTLSPLANQSLQVAYGDGYLTTLFDTSHLYTWAIYEDLSTSNYTIEDGTGSVVWYLQQPVPDETITYAPMTTGHAQFWWFYNA